MLSKYSGVLVAGSAGIAFLVWARGAERWRGLGWIALGVVAVGAIPPLLWNASHEWSSLLYQIRDRHEGASVSLVRYARFWVIQAFAGSGPLLLAFTALAAWGFAAWFRPLGLALPAALIYCTQPLWADFKPHWALVVWWPMALALASCATAGERFLRLARWQTRYGISLGLVVLFCCHVPVGGWILALWGRAPDGCHERLLWVGWASNFLAGQGALGAPVVGSRYQTASQASFALGEKGRVTLLPRDIKARDEWPDLGISTGQGPDWPRLTETVYFVADNRYDEGPLFPGARCAKLGRVDGRRGPPGEAGGTCGAGRARRARQLSRNIRMPRAPSPASGWSNLVRVSHMQHMDPFGLRHRRHLLQQLGVQRLRKEEVQLEEGLPGAHEGIAGLPRET